MVRSLRFSGETTDGDAPDEHTGTPCAACCDTEVFVGAKVGICKPVRLFSAKGCQPGRQPGADCAQGVAAVDVGVLVAADARSAPTQACYSDGHRVCINELQLDEGALCDFIGACECASQAKSTCPSQVLLCVQGRGRDACCAQGVSGSQDCAGANSVGLPREEGVAGGRGKADAAGDAGLGWGGRRGR